jgi:ligand-binding sensor domain-containing protein
MLAFSCGENKSKVKDADTSEFAVSIKTDTLKFTSGIRAIFQDSKGNYWFGSLQEGAAVYNGNSFSYFTTNEGLSDNQIQRIREDEEGLIWFNTQSGISSYDGESIKNHISTRNDDSKSFNSLSFDGTTQNKWMKTDTDLWFGAGIKEGVYRYDGVKLIYLAFPPHQVLNHYDNLFAVTSISKGSNNMIWFGTYAGVFGYNGSKFTIINDETLDFDRAIAPIHIRSILEDSKGRLWIGNNGIGVLLKEGDSIFNFSEEKNLIHPSSSRKGDKSPPGTLEHIFRITEDSQGNIWFGDRDTGVWKYDGVNIKNYTEKDGIIDCSALSIYVDNNGELWFGMRDGNVYKFNGEIFEKQF